MRDSEEAAEKLTAALLQMNTIWQMLFNLVFIGLLTAIVEEFMFRGVIQTIFKVDEKHHAAIWITAIIIQRLSYGVFWIFAEACCWVAMFGYFVAWSGSIWPAVFGGILLNNGTAVVVTYLYQNKILKLTRTISTYLIG